MSPKVARIALHCAGAAQSAFPSATRHSLRQRASLLATAQDVPPAQSSTVVQSAPSATSVSAFLRQSVESSAARVLVMTRHVSPEAQVLVVANGAQTNVQRSGPSMKGETSQIESPSTVERFAQLSSALQNCRQ